MGVEGRGKRSKKEKRSKRTGEGEGERSRGKGIRAGRPVVKIENKKRRDTVVSGYHSGLDVIKRAFIVRRGSHEGDLGREEGERNVFLVLGWGGVGGQ